MSYYEDVFSFFVKRFYDFLQKAACSGIKFIEAFAGVFGSNVFFRMIEKHIDRTIWYLKASLDAFIFSESHFLEPVIEDYRDVTAFKDDLCRFFCPDQRRTIAYVEMGSGILFRSLPCHGASLFAKRDVSPALELTEFVPFCFSVS